jgi:UDP:flavonoid glycosyltransferase YjiC (YdhE family)
MALKRRLLFLAEGATMQHFVRPLALAEGLDPDRFEIHLYAPRRYHRYLLSKPFHTGELATMPSEQFLANLSHGAPLFPASVLRGYLKDERALISRLKPDLVIGDLRFSLPVSARLEEVRCAVLMNAYWSPHAKRRGVIPELPITRLIPPRWLGGLYRLTEPLALAMHVRAINSVRREHGFSPLPPDPRHMYTDGDYVLYPDVPEFAPVTSLPANHYYLGPCNWELPGEKPHWWTRMIADPKPKVFVSLGSSGPVRILPRLLEVLAKRPVSVILATVGRMAPADRTGLYAAPLLPFFDTAAASSVVISHGGSSGFYPAIAAAAPVLGIPSNADQQIAAQVLAESGAGLNLRVEEASTSRLHRALDDLLNDSQYRDSARRWAGVYARYHTPTLFASFLDEVFPPFEPAMPPF